MKKIKIILTLVLISFIMVLAGCSGGKLTAPPWNEDDIKRIEDGMNDTSEASTEVEVSPWLRYEF